MRLFARYLLLTALIAAAVLISDVNAKSRVRHSQDHDKNSVHEINLEHKQHKRSYSSHRYPSSSGLSGSGKSDKYSHSSSSSKLTSSKKHLYPPSGGLSGSQNGKSRPPVHKPVSKPISSNNKTHGSGSGSTHPGRHPSSKPSDSHPTSKPKPVISNPPTHGHSGGESFRTTRKPSTKRPPTSSYGNWTNQNIITPKNDSGLYKKPGTSYPQSNGLSGGGSGSNPTPKPALNPSSKRPPISSHGNWTNQNIITPKNDSGLNRKPGTSYPQSNGLSGGGSGSYPTPKPAPNPSSKRPLTSSHGNWTNQNIITPKNDSGLNKKPGTSYPQSNGLSGGGSGSYPTPKPAPNPSSKRPPTSSLGNWTNQNIITPKNDSGLNRKPGTSYPQSNGLSGGGSGSHPTTHKLDLYPPSIRPPVNNPNVIYQPVVVHHIHSYESHSSFLPHQKLNTYRPAYVYAPPSRIHYRNSHGHVENYPVYNHHSVPPYVNDYWKSENKYGNLLSGLALYNLGMVSGSRSKNKFHKQYVQKPNEICIFEAKYKTGTTDEMAIDCIIMTYFIFMEEYKNPIHGGSSAINNDTDVMLPNGTLVSDKVAYQLTNANSNMPLRQIMRPGGAIVYRASESMFNGKPVNYKLLKECNIGRSTLFSDFKKEVPCGLLQTYAEISWRKNSGAVLKSSLSVILIAVCVVFL